MSRYNCAGLKCAAFGVLGAPCSAVCSCEDWPMATARPEVSGGWTGVCCCTEVAISGSGRSYCVVCSVEGAAESAPTVACWTEIVGRESRDVATGSTGGTMVVVLEVTSAQWSPPKSSRINESDIVAEEVDGLGEVARGRLVEGAVDGVNKV